MYKFLYGLVLFFFLCLGFGVYATLYPAEPRAYEDPTMTQIKACIQKQERILQPLDESGKAEVTQWCIRRQYRTN